jgi:hypothetical protein
MIQGKYQIHPFPRRKEGHFHLKVCKIPVEIIRWYFLREYGIDG